MAHTEASDDRHHRALKSSQHHLALQGGCLNYLETPKGQDRIWQLSEAFAKLRISIAIDRLPPEILLKIIEHFAETWVLTDDPADWDVYTLDHHSRERQETLISLSKTSRSLSATATTVIYRCVHLATAKSARLFLRTLQTQPEVRSLVKQISCPHLVYVRPAYAFSHDLPNYDKLSHVAALLHDKCDTIAYHELLEILQHIRHVRVLSVPQARLALVSGPWGGYLWLEHLRKLRISVPFLSSTSLDGSTLRRVLDWLHPNVIMTAYPALEYLEVLSPFGRWQAELTTSGPPLLWPGKFVKSLSTTLFSVDPCMDWHLMTLEQPVFDPSYCHTFHFSGPAWTSHHQSDLTGGNRWNLNRFFTTNGRSICVLSLDFRVSDFNRNVLFGARRITTLNELTNLTHLTISLDVLYGQDRFFAVRIGRMQHNPLAEINQLFPESLRVLRLNEYMTGIFTPMLILQSNYRFRLQSYLSAVCLFIHHLLHYWLEPRGDRELWVKHLESLLELLEMDFPEPGMPHTHHWGGIISEKKGGGGREFVQMLRPT